MSEPQALHLARSGASHDGTPSSHLLSAKRIMLPSERRHAYISPYNWPDGARGRSSLMPPASEAKISHLPSYEN